MANVRDGHERKLSSEAAIVERKNPGGRSNLGNHQNMIHAENIASNETVLAGMRNNVSNF